MESIIPLFIIKLLLLGNETANLIDTTCSSTPNYQLCVKILRTDPRSSSAADARELGLIIVDALKSKAEEAARLIETLKKTNPELRRPLNHCSGVYYAVLIADIPEAVEALSKGVPKFAEDGVADAALEARECERALKGSNAPLSDLNKSVEDLSNVARAVIRLLL